MTQMPQTGIRPVLPVREPYQAAEWPPLDMSSQNVPIHLLKSWMKTILQQLPLHLRGSITPTRHCIAHLLNLFPIPNLEQGRWCFRNLRAKKVRHVNICILYITETSDMITAFFIVLYFLSFRIRWGSRQFEVFIQNSPN